MAKAEKTNVKHSIPLKKKITLLSGNGWWQTHAIPKYDVPPIKMNDGPAGLRKPLENGETPEGEVGGNNTYKATCFPSLALCACSWDESLMEEFGQAMANECKAREVNVILSPGVNIKRNPLGGRNFEYLSEDPYLSGKMASAFISSCQNEGVGTCLKHFAMNEQETRRFTYTAEVDDRAFHEIYLKPFEMVVKEANPWMVMASYNRINGVYSCNNKYLLQDLLKGEWNYDGVVVSDWGAVNEVIESHKNGMDLEMPCFDSKSRNKVLYKAIKKGKLPIKTFNDSTHRILSLVDKAKKLKKEDARYEENHKFAVKMAEHSIVLAQNENMLPLHDYDDVCVIGELARSPRYQAGGSSHVEMMNPKSFLEVVNEGRKTPIPFEPGYSLSKTSEENEAAMNFDACDLASTHKKVILFLGTREFDEAEGYDKETMRLPNEQYRLFEDIYAINPNIIVVISSGSPIEISSLNKAKAILITYLPGEGGYEALSNIILGLADPSGRLAESWPMRYLDVPSSTFFPGNNDFSLYKESIFVGYRYYLTAGLKVQYPFGYGLSYTRFKYSDLVVSNKTLNDGKRLSVSFNIENAGGRNGEETAQVYISCLNSKTFREKRALKAFKKVSINAESSKPVKLFLNYEDFSIWSIEKKQFVVEDGDYLIEVGSSSEDIKLQAKVHVSSNYVATDETFKIPNYYSVSAKRPFSLVDDEFAYLLGRDYVDDLPNKNSKIDLNSNFGEIADTNVGRTLISAFKKKFAEEYQGDERMERELKALMNTPIRFVCLADLSDRYAMALVAFANGRLLKAIHDFVAGKRK